MEKAKQVISKYKQLNTIEIPKKAQIKGVIVDDLFYIIWEEDLLKPKIFKYSFASHYHANKYATQKLKQYRYNILPGKTLIEFGITFGDYTVGKAAKIPHKNQSKYAFHPQLSMQRKKTLRNLYRRNQRRLLQKLLLLKNK